MHVIGHIAKGDKFWAAEVAVLGVYTQGVSRDDARVMIADAVESLVNEPGFKVTVGEIASDGSVLVTSNQTGALVAYLLKHNRANSALSLADVAEHTGKARNNYAQYEQGTATPSIDKLQEFLDVVAPGMVVAVVSSSATLASRSGEGPIERNAGAIDARLRKIEALLETRPVRKRKKPARR